MALIMQNYMQKKNKYTKQNAYNGRTRHLTNKNEQDRGMCVFLEQLALNNINVRCTLEVLNGKTC